MTNRNKIPEVLRNIPLFSSLSDGEISSLCLDEKAALAVYSPDQVVYNDESFRRALGVVISGKLVISRMGNGSRVILNTVSKGDIFGAASLFGAPDRYVTEITAKTRATLFFIPSELCERLIRDNASFAVCYITFLSDRIRFLNRRISELSAPRTEGKLAKFLTESPSPITPNMKELASFLGIGRASLYRMIADFTEKGIIKREGKSIIILDKEKLHDLI